MNQRIDKIITKAECIKRYLLSANKEVGNIEGLINSLKSYRDNVGDIPEEKLFIMSVDEDAWKRLKEKNLPVIEAKQLFGWKVIFYTDPMFYIGIKSIEFTSYIARKTLDNILFFVRQNEYSSYFPKIYSIPPIVLSEHIADSVFDVQSFSVGDPYLTAELINAGLKPTTNNIKFVCDFD